MLKILFIRIRFASQQKKSIMHIPTSVYQKGYRLFLTIFVWRFFLQYLFGTYFLAVIYFRNIYEKTMVKYFKIL